MGYDGVYVLAWQYFLPGFLVSAGFGVYSLSYVGQFAPTCFYFSIGEIIIKELSIPRLLLASNAYHPKLVE